MIPNSTKVSTECNTSSPFIHGTGFLSCNIISFLVVGISCKQYLSVYPINNVPNTYNKLSDLAGNFSRSISNVFSSITQAFDGYRSIVSGGAVPHLVKPTSLSDF